MELTLTQADLDKALKAKAKDCKPSETCVVAQAAKRQFHTRKVSCGGQHMEVGKATYYFGEELRQAIRDFDTGQSVRLGTFPLRTEWR